MEYIIRNAVAEDMAGVLMLINELAIFENEPDAVIINEAYLVKEGFKQNPSFTVFVAEMNDTIVGIALFYPRFSTWKGKTFHLEDLIVTKDKRGLGIGKALYSHFLKHAYAQNVKRVEWAVLDWNTNAIAFYEKTGAKVFDDWRTVQMNETQLKNYVTSLSKSK